VSKSFEDRFKKYGEAIGTALAHVDRRTPMQWYLRGLLLPGGRKSVEPMAARVQPHNVRSAHQSMHHLVANAEWSDRGLLAAVSAQVLPALIKKDAACHWIIDDTGYGKKGTHSVGVARQYCERLGKTDNCQVAVSLSIANEHGSLPVAYQLYLPQDWANDRARCIGAGVPAEIVFRTTGELALEQIQQALKAGLPRGVVLADAVYGTEAAWCEQLSAWGLQYAVAVRDHTRVWHGKHQPAHRPPAGVRGGRARSRLVIKEKHAPVTMIDLAQRLPARYWRQVSWRAGTNVALQSRFTALRVQAVSLLRARPEEWLLIEWPLSQQKPVHYWLCTLPANTPIKQLVATAVGRWQIEHGYQKLKSELGLHHYEGRNWRGFHHHASLCIAAYGFLICERLRNKKNPLNSKRLRYQKLSSREGQRSDAMARSQLNRHNGLQPRPPDRKRAAQTSLLRHERDPVKPS